MIKSSRKMSKMGIKNRTTAAFVVSACVLGILSGCATNATVTSLTHKAERRSKADLSLPANRGDVVQVYHMPYLMGSVLSVAPAVPSFLKQKIVYHSAVSVPLNSVTSYVTDETGVPIDISALSNSSTLGLSLGGVYPKISVNYSGSLAGMLNVLSDDAGAFWKISDGKIVFYRSVTKTFWLISLPHKSTDVSSVSSISGSGGASGGGMGGGMGMSGGMSGSGQGGFGGASGGSSENSSMGGISAENTYKTDSWAGIEKTAKIIAGTARIAVDPTSGSITVTGSPAQVKRVQSWVKNLNTYYGQEVEVQMHVYNVQLSSEDNYGFSPSVIYKAVNGTTGFNVTSLSVPNVQGLGNPAVFDIAKTNSTTTTPYNGTTAAVNALSSLGHVVQVYAQTQVTTNGHPTVLQTGNSISYLYSVSNLATANVGSSSTLTPGVINTGLTTVVMPKIIGGAIHLGVTLTNSNLVSITSASSNGSTIQTPDVNSTSIEQSVLLHPGDALLLTSLRGEKGSSTHNGTGSPLNPLLGGGFDAQTSKTLIAVVITAKVL